MLDPNTISIQLYTVREELAADFEGTIRRIAEIGFPAIETASFPEGVTVEAARSLFDSLGLKVSAAHQPLPLAADKNRVLDNIATLGCDFLVCAYFPPEEFATLDSIKRVCESLNEGNAVARDNGLTFAYHNHWWEVQDVEGKPAHEHMLDLLDESVMFELDTYWARVGGRNPADLVAMLGDRAPLLHIKDGPGTTPEAAHVAVGAGAIDIEGILKVSRAQWHAIELDRCETDMMTTVEQSYGYMKGLAS